MSQKRTFLVHNTKAVYLGRGYPDNSKMSKETYTPQEAARILEVPLRHLLERLSSGEIKGQRDPNSGRWKISGRALRGLLRAEEQAPAGADSEKDSNELPKLSSARGVPREPSGQRASELIGEIRAVVGRSREEIERLRDCLQQAQQSEEAMGEALERERRRVDSLRRENDKLKAELEARAPGSRRESFRP